MPNQGPVLFRGELRSGLRHGIELRDAFSNLAADAFGDDTGAPTAWGPALSPYRYVYSNDNVLLVEPGSRRIIQIVD